MHHVRPAGQVHRRLHQYFVERHVDTAEPAHPSLVAQGLAQRRAQGESRVLHRVVGVDVQIALCPYGQIEPAVSAELGEHVVVEADPGGDVGASRAIDGELDPNLGLGRVTLDRGATISGATISGSRIRFRNHPAAAPSRAGTRRSPQVCPR